MPCIYLVPKGHAHLRQIPLASIFALHTRPHNNFERGTLGFAVFGVENMGRGRVIYLADNPLFRAFWYNGKLLFGNAVFIVGC